MYKKLVITLVLILSVSFFAIGCSKEGPMEKAGKKVDKAVEDAGDKMEKATE